uniref:Uncharacterized protein n=1 Tax=Anopheles darlingi TaxID=43151 RepID=A0A2M4D0A4_ANODA
MSARGSRGGKGGLRFLCVFFRLCCVYGLVSFGLNSYKCPDFGPNVCVWFVGIVTPLITILSFLGLPGFPFPMALPLSYR